MGSESDLVTSCPIFLFLNQKTARISLQNLLDNLHHGIIFSLWNKKVSDISYEFPQERKEKDSIIYIFPTFLFPKFRSQNGNFFSASRFSLQLIPFSFSFVK